MIGSTAAVSLVFWSQLQDRKRVYIRDLTRVLARTVQRELFDEMSSRMLAHERLAKLIEDGIPHVNWENQAKLLIEHNPGIVAEQWLDATFQVRWVVTEPMDAERQSVLLRIDAPLRSLLEHVVTSRTKDAELTRPFHLWNGKLGRRIVVPIHKGENFLGFLIAILDEEKSFESILQDQVGILYSTVIFEDNEEIYRMPGSSLAREKKWGQDVELQLPGARWRVRVWPKPHLFHQIGATLLKMALAAGSLIGLLFFLTINFALTAYRDNQELNRARDELESRVQERTAQLQSSNKDLEAEINERTRAQESLQEVSGRLLQLRDEERRRIARELHDSTAQTLGALAINLDRAQQLVSKGEISKLQERLAQSTDLAHRATNEIRIMAYLLHPPLLEGFGLEDTLAWYAEGFSKLSGIQISLCVQPGLRRLPQELELTLFRVAQEALTNIHRHAGSPTADIIVFREANQVTLQVTDRGRGLPPGTLESLGGGRALVGIGIAGMRERVKQLKGRLDIVSDSNGTVVKAVLPIDSVVQADEGDNHGEARVA